MRELGKKVSSDACFGCIMMLLKGSEDHKDHDHDGTRRREAHAEGMKVLSCWGIAKEKMETTAECARKNADPVSECLQDVNDANIEEEVSGCPSPSDLIKAGTEMEKDDEKKGHRRREAHSK